MLSSDSYSNKLCSATKHCMEGCAACHDMVPSWLRRVVFVQPPAHLPGQMCRRLYEHDSLACRASSYHGAPVARRFCTGLQAHEDRGESTVWTTPRATSSSWRSPNWLVPYLAPSAVPPPASSSSWMALVVLGALGFAGAARILRKREAMLKLAASGMLLSSVGLVYVGYTRLEELTSSAVSGACYSVLERGVTVGRLRRVTPLGFHFAGATLGPCKMESKRCYSPQPPHSNTSGATLNPRDGAPSLAATAPDATTRAVVVSVSRVFPALRGMLPRSAGKTRLTEPLVLNVSLVQPAFRIRQIVEMNADGLPTAKWDPGIPETRSQPQVEAHPHSFRQFAKWDPGIPETRSQQPQVVNAFPVYQGPISRYVEDDHRLQQPQAVKALQEHDVRDPKPDPVHHVPEALSQSRGDSGFGSCTSSSTTSLGLVLGRLLIKNATVFLQPGDLGIYGQGPELVELRKVTAEMSVDISPVTFRSNSGQCSGDGDADYSSSEKHVTQMQVGLAKAQARGFPVGGGVVELSASCDLSKLIGKAQDALGSTIQPGDTVADVNVKGNSVEARSIAAFLNLPFRADSGRCDGDIDMRFLYQDDCMIPEMHGTTALHDVSLRFHPDPKTPEFTGISGGMRFDDKTMFMDGPSGDLGSLPMTVVGSIDLVGDYNLVGYVRNVDVNSIVNTFEVDKFVPVTGQVKGEARMTGPLEEPFIQGWAVSVGPGSFDRVPVDHGRVKFEWDAVAGVLEFTDISASLAGGGGVSGKGGMFFDMTKITPFDMHRPSHHPNSPKANAVPPRLPRDDLDIDMAAPIRPYDSMLFEFAIRNVEGGDLVAWYGGPAGHVAASVVGTVEADAVLAGNAKDANCRVLWRSISPPPPVTLGNKSSNSEDDGPEGSSVNKGEVYLRPVRGMFVEAKKLLQMESPSPSPEASFPGSKELGGGDFRGVVFMKMGDLPAARRVKIRTTISNFDARRLGWGDPEQKKYLADTPLMSLSADTYFKGVLRQRLVPVEEGSGLNPRTPEAELLGGDGVLAVRRLRLNKLHFAENMTGSLSFGAGDCSLVLKEREISLSDHIVRASRATKTNVARSMRAWRVGDDQYVTRPLSSPVDAEYFKESSSDPTPPLSPKNDVDQKASKSKSSAESAEKNKEGTGEGSPGERSGDELCVSYSADGDGSLSLRSGRAEVVLAIEEDPQHDKVVSFFVREFSMDNVFGGNGKGSNGIPSATLGFDGDVNLKQCLNSKPNVADGSQLEPLQLQTLAPARYWPQRGGLSVSVKRARYGDLSVDSLTGNILLQEDKLGASPPGREYFPSSYPRIVLERTVARIGRSEYHLEGEYSKGDSLVPDGIRARSQTRFAGPSWEMRLTIPSSANVKELTRFVGSRQFPSVNTPLRRRSQSASISSKVWTGAGLRKSPISGDGDSGSGMDRDTNLGHDAVESWSMPNMQFDRQMAWFRSYVEAEKEFSKRDKIVEQSRHGSKTHSPLARPGLADLEGKMKGQIVLRYDAGANRRKQPLSGPSPFEVLREAAGKTSFEFDVRGEDWMLGSHPLGEVSAVGKFDGSKLELESFGIRGPKGFEVSAGATVTSCGNIAGYGFVKDLSAKTLSHYMRTKFRLSGKMSARVDVAGGVSDPAIDGQAAWVGAALNGRSVRNARGDAQCRNGRCTMNLNARFGGRSASGEPENQLDVHRPLTGLKENIKLFSRPRKVRDGDEAGGESTSIAPSGVGTSGSEGRNRLSGEPLNVAVSVPVRFYVLEYLRKSVPSNLWSELRPLLAFREGFEEDWISVDVDIRKYGLLLLGAVFPDLGWIDGSSDINMQVHGNLSDPVIEGKCRVSDGQLWPAVFTQPFENVRGEIVFDQSGSVTARSVSGKYNGRSISISGSLPLTSEHLRATREAASRKLPKEQPLSRAERRAFLEKRSAATSQLERFSRGVVIDVPEVFLAVKDQFYGKVSGRVVATQALLSPSLTGIINFSKGVVYLAAPPISPETALASMPAMFSQIRSEFLGFNTGKQTSAPMPVDNGTGDGAVTGAGIRKKGGIRQSRAVPVPVEEARSESGKPGGALNTVELNDLKLSLGKDVELVYPYLLKFGATGVISLDGSSAAPTPSGTIHFTQGEVNLLTSKMFLSQSGRSNHQGKSSDDNYARFEKGSGVPDPVISLSLEDRDFMVQVKETKSSKMLERVTVTSRRGEGIMEDTPGWLVLLQSRLEELQRGFSGGRGIPSLAAKYLFNSFSLRGKIGPTRWRLYPALVGGGYNFQSGLPDEYELNRHGIGEPFSSREGLDDFGLGAEFDYGKVAFSLRGSLKGAREGSLVIYPNDRIRLEFESNGPRTSGEIEVRVSSSSRHTKRRNGVDDSCGEVIVYDADGISVRSMDDVDERAHPGPEQKSQDGQPPLPSSEEKSVGTGESRAEMPPVDGGG